MIRTSDRVATVKKPIFDFRDWSALVELIIFIVSGTRELGRLRVNGYPDRSRSRVEPSSSCHNFIFHCYPAKLPLRVMSGNARSDDIESAFHPKADIARRGWKVRSGPKADIDGLTDRTCIAPILRLWVEKAACAQ